MSRSRHSVLFLIAGFSLAAWAAFAQESDSSIAPTSGGGGGGMESIAPSSGGGGGVSTEPTAPSTAPEMSTPSGNTTGATGGGPVSTSGAPERNTAPAVSIPRGGAQVPLVLQPGSGRFDERPLKFRFDVSHGFDDNVNTSPDNPPPPTPKPPTFIEIPNPYYVPAPVTTPLIPGNDPIEQFTPKPQVSPKTLRFAIPTPDPTPAYKRIGTMVTRANLGINYAKATARSVGILDLTLGSSYYWTDSVAKQNEYIGGLSLAYNRNISARSRFSLSLSSVYKQDPDFSLVNAPTSQGSGSYLNTQGDAAYTYKWSPRFSTSTDLLLSSNLYQEASSKNDNVTTTTLSQKFLYLWNPRQTLVLDAQYGTNLRGNKALNSYSMAFLAGLDTVWNPRFNTTFRLGEELITYQSGGVGTSMPRLEANLRYLLQKGSNLTFVAEARPGNPDAVGDKVTELRSGLSYTQVFTPRSLAFISLNWIEQKTEFADPAQDPVTQQNISCGLGMRYMVSPRTRFSLDYTFMQQLTNAKYSDYHRNQIFFGFEHDF